MSTQHTKVQNTHFLFKEVRKDSTKARLKPCWANIKSCSFVSGTWGFSFKGLRWFFLKLFTQLHRLPLPHSASHGNCLKLGESQHLVVSKWNPVLIFTSSYNELPQSPHWGYLLQTGSYNSARLKAQKSPWHLNCASFFFQEMTHGVLALDWPWSTGTDQQKVLYEVASWD